ncbi:adenylyl-sulfate kinase [Paenibacillus campi]|uniref:adenylyl-sulfate kinase n=1 Tax=Paenibacillus campi TaxID=3106031 RepID=UPI002AFF42D5|nr:adenylyl-sulfate kinase [Paenibacillus sp. SGZ-1009]
MSKNNIVLWFTGLSGSGKTTISNILSARLKELAVATETLDGDVVRQELSPDLGFSEADREQHNMRIIYVSKLLSQNGIVTIVPVIAPFKRVRDHARQHIENFVEIYVNTPIDECIKRDPKGLYEKALKGEIKQFTGLSSPYEVPENPHLIIETINQTPEQCCDQILTYLKEHKYIATAVSQTN